VPIILSVEVAGEAANSFLIANKLQLLTWMM
jgi:hypothetical protein